TRRLLLEGDRPYLQKPFTAEELLSRLEEALGRARRAGPARVRRRLVRSREVVLVRGTHQEVEREKQRLRERKEDERNHHHQRHGGDLEELPWRVRPGPEQKPRYPYAE